MLDSLNFPIYNSDKIQAKEAVKARIEKVLNKKEVVLQDFNDKALGEFSSIIVIGLLADTMGLSKEISWESFKGTMLSTIIATYWLVFRYVKKNVQAIILEKKEKKLRKKLDELLKEVPDVLSEKIPAKTEKFPTENQSPKIIRLNPNYRAKPASRLIR